MLAAWALLIAGAEAVDFKSCATTDHAHVSVVTLDPAQPVHGQHIKVHVTTTPDVTVTAGSVDVVVSAFGVQIPGAPDYDLCKDVGLACPIAPGTAATAVVDYGVSKLVPAGIGATVKLTFKDGAAAELGCITFDVTVTDSSKSFLDSVEGFWPHHGSRKEQVEPAPSALSKLLSSPATASAAELAGKLQAAYKEQPQWAGLFRAWRAQQQAKTPYSSPAEEGRRFAAFKANMLRLDGMRGLMPPPLADKHSDKTADELRTLGHFA